MSKTHSENDPTKKVDFDDDVDDEDDEDYNPENADNSEASEIDEDDEIEGEDAKVEKVTRSNDALSTNKSTNNGSSLVQIDDEKINLLWSDFLDDSNSGKKSEPTKEKKVIENRQYDFAGETVVVQEEVKVETTNQTKSPDDLFKEFESKETDNNKNKQPIHSNNTATRPTTRVATPAIKRRSGGLSDLLDQMNKKPKMSTLTKSLHDWNEYKKAESIEEELDQHRRSKNSFIERQAFLERTDLREFEREKSIRDHERKVREINNKPKN